MQDAKDLICWGCVGESVLRNEIPITGNKGYCKYCKRFDFVLSIPQLAGRIHQAISDHYVRWDNSLTDYERYMLSEDPEYRVEPKGAPIIPLIAELAGISMESAADVQAYLLETEGYPEALWQQADYEKGSYYLTKKQSARGWEQEWWQFERSLKKEARFFNAKGWQLLSRIFADLESMSTWSAGGVVVKAGPGTSIAELYRARVFQNTADLTAALKRPDVLLGPPEARYASSNRMNAKGVSVFYGAESPQTAIAEVRPPVGAKVAVTKFEILRPLSLLDLTALREIDESGSKFDRTLVERMKRAKFLEILSHKMTAPVMPDDAESEYLPTQVIADFLASRSGVALDGIIYPSIQVDSGARNVILFHKSSRVAPLRLYQGTATSVDIESFDGMEVKDDFRVVDYLPLNSLLPDSAKVATNLFGQEIQDDPDKRIPALEVMREQITVHSISHVSYSTKEHPVTYLEFGPTGVGE